MNYKTLNCQSFLLSKDSYKHRWAIVLMSFLHFTQLLIAQNSVNFKARASSSIVGIEENFQVFYTLENATAEDFTPPSFYNFEVLSGPNLSSHVQFYNGQVYKQEEYSFILRPLKAGKYNIAPAKVKIHNKTLKSNGLTVVVVSKSSKENPSGVELFVKVELSNDTIYLGQQLLLNYKVYTKLNVERYSFEKEPDYSGFYAEEIDRFYSPAVTEIVNDESYTTKIIRKLALFPLQTGTHQIDAAKINFLIFENRGLFFNRNVRNIREETKPVAITVLPLPTGAPPTFSGAVGKFNFDANIESTNLKVGEGTSLNFIITGNGDPKRVIPPILPSNDTFEVYVPNIVYERVEGGSEGELLQQIQAQYFVIPKISGVFSLTPEFCYFDSDAKKYVALKKDPIHLKVHESIDLQANLLQQKFRLPQIRPLKQISAFKSSKFIFFNSLLFWFLLIFPLAALFSKKVIRLLHIGNQKHNDANLENIQLLLKEIRTHDYSDNVSIKNDFTKLHEAFRKYLIIKLGLSNGFSKQELEEALNQNTASPQLKTAIFTTLEQLSIGAYSPWISETDLKDATEKVASTLMKIKELNFTSSE